MPYELQASLDHQLPGPPSVYHPQLALIVYASAHGAFLLRHPVHDTSHGFETGSGSALSGTDVDTFMQAASQASMTFTQANTLAAGPGRVAWWLPPGSRALTFEPAYEGTKSLASLNGTPIPHPGLVFVAGAGSLRVFAVRGRGRPTAATALCHAPYWNLFGDGRMCRGTVAYPKSATPADQQVWEAAFFGSAFTHPSRTMKDTHWGVSYEELLRRAVDDGAFPQTALMDAGLTVRGALA
ncbi:PRTRC system protein B [Deinococcus frigens]|uniref:PRTRC system protein B n=1 Tax=Deinococcus frigens TaxID=249403 RepID=UPI0004977617|nr:PRTRC system protein B [Deinococcus frigens]